MAELPEIYQLSKQMNERLVETIKTGSTTSFIYPNFDASPWLKPGACGLQFLVKN